MKLAPDDPRHGTVNGYVNYGCRCQECRNAATKYAAKQRSGSCPKCGGKIGNRYVAKVCRACRVASVEAPHGTESRYQRCRCDQCREAANAARLRRRRAMSPEEREIVREKDRIRKRRTRTPVS